MGASVSGISIDAKHVSSYILSPAAGLDPL